MKKVIYLLVLCMVLGMAGCGTNQENKEPVSGNVSVETENKENDDVVQNEQIADTGSYPPCVMVDGVIYKDTGYVDFYVMEASDEEFDTEEVRKLVKRLDELDPIPLPWKSDEEALKDFWDYCEERQREERIIAEMKIKDENKD